MADPTKTIDQFLSVSDLTDGDITLGLRGGITDLSIDLPAAILNKIIQNVETKKYGLAVSVAGNAMTIALKKSDGSTDPGTGKDSLWFKFRSSTLTSGAVAFRQVSSALSLVISSGSTLGQVASSTDPIYIYLIDNAGTLELAASSTNFWDEGVLQSTIAEGGDGAADSSLVLYSATARSNVPVHLIGRIKAPQVTPGTWATGPAEVVTGPFGVIPWVDDSRITTGTVNRTETVLPLAVGQTAIINWALGITGGVNRTVTIAMPAGGTYQFAVSISPVGNTTNVLQNLVNPVQTSSFGVVAGGSTIGITVNSGLSQPVYGFCKRIS